MTQLRYVGQELELFQHAAHWKRYLRAQIAPFLGRRVLEVGAGLGATAAMLCDGTQSQWLCLEPDGALLDQLCARLSKGELPACCVPRQGTTGDLTPPTPSTDRFDTVLYVDVIEHIQDDAAELARAAALLAPRGRLIVLAPAHQWLFTPFDQAIGHFRRYDKAMLRAAAPRGLTPQCLRYLDAVGLLASLANKLLLRQSMPTLAQVRAWDGVLVPASRVLDPLLGYTLGKSVLGVWTR